MNLFLHNFTFNPPSEKYFAMDDEQMSDEVGTQLKLTGKSLKMFFSSSHNLGKSSFADSKSIE